MVEPLKATGPAVSVGGVQPGNTVSVGSSGMVAAGVEGSETLRDTIRWGPILGGLATAISSLVVLTVLGLAVGLSSLDAQDDLSKVGLGTGWWSAISALLAFAIGGFVAGCTAALVRGRPHGAINGFLVWAAAIPLILFLVTGGLVSFLRTTAEVAAPTVGEATGAAMSGQAQGATQAVRSAADTVQQQISAQATGENVEQAAQVAGRGMWWTLASLVLALAAAVLGGLLGGRWHAGQHRQLRSVVS